MMHSLRRMSLVMVRLSVDTHTSLMRIKTWNGELRAASYSNSTGLAVPGLDQAVMLSGNS